MIYTCSVAFPDDHQASPLEESKGVVYTCSVDFPDNHQASPLEESKGWSILVR